jgi:hypothetical protein
VPFGRGPPAVSATPRTQIRPGQLRAVPIGSAHASAPAPPPPSAGDSGCIACANCCSCLPNAEASLRRASAPRECVPSASVVSTCGAAAHKARLARSAPAPCCRACCAMADAPYVLAHLAQPSETPRVSRGCAKAPGGVAAVSLAQRKPALTWARHAVRCTRIKAHSLSALAPRKVL